ncbi:hypothetical protein QO010_002234 [Caulobacter ginsengisoli]|uniref:YbjN domain-containing protein n=1 Tax=Caulobacter ginsengisoli TaxID=400775 RepID=A0ABU0IR17_9CAUL|nr:hypothetical protein [Caulobacter ginsengisoli]MDQ0464453.1 hypothetical protein [Caulobacter ginsengisoli]
MSKKIAATQTLVTTLALCATMAFGGAAQAAGFSAGSSADVARVLQADGFTATTKVEGNKPYVAATTSDGTKFVVEFYKCDTSKLNCKVAIYTANWTEEPTLDQINRWNRWTFVCPVYGAADKSTSVWMGVMVDPSDNAQTVELQLKTFNGCLSDFQAFLTNPEAFLKDK